MSRDDDIDLDWHDVKEEGGVQYTEVPWDTPPPTPPQSPRAVQQLAAALQAAMADPVKMQRLAALLREPTEKKVVIDTPPAPLPSTEIPSPPPTTVAPSADRVRLVKRRVHGAL